MSVMCGRLEVGREDEKGWCLYDGGDGEIVVVLYEIFYIFFFFFQAEDGIRDVAVTGVQTCALPISVPRFRGYVWTAVHHRPRHRLGAPIPRLLEEQEHFGAQETRSVPCFLSIRA